MSSTLSCPALNIEFTNMNSGNKVDAPSNGNGPGLQHVENGPAQQQGLAAKAPTALNYLCEAIKAAVEDLNTRFNAGLETRQTQTTFEVRELEKSSALIRVDLTDQNDIQYSHFIKRNDEMQSGIMHVCVGGSGESSIMFPDLPHSPLQVSYQEASKRLLNPTF
ncbi:MAG TPA: hypothetical protein VK738_21100 [Terriglobales bacterium]|nr:hypothetical protein [Terriglobales bacterium]